MRKVYKSHSFSIKRLQPSISALVVGVGGCAGGNAGIKASPSVAIMRALRDSWEVEVTFADPHVSAQALPEFNKLENGSWDVARLANFDVIVIAARQVGLDFRPLEEIKGPIVHYCC